MSDSTAASGYLARQARQARDLVGPFSTAALTALQAEAATLPARCDLVTATLVAAREPVMSDVRRIARAIEREADGRRTGAVAAAVRRADTPMARVAVAKAFVALREVGMVDEHLAAAALIELTGPRSRIAEAAVLHAGTALRAEAQEMATAGASAGASRRTTGTAAPA